MGAGFQSFGGGSAGFSVQVGAKGLNTFAIYDSNIGRFVENYFYQSTASMGGGTGFRSLDQSPQSAPGGISEAPHKTPTATPYPRPTTVPEGQSIPGSPGAIFNPGNWPTVVVGGKVRLKLPPNIGGGKPPVLERIPIPLPEIGVARPSIGDVVEEPDYPGKPGTVKETEMAVDWGAIAMGAIDIWQGQNVGNQPSVFNPTNFAGPSGGGGVAPGPAKVVVDTRTGAITKCNRRRRRRLLTSTDINDLAALKAIVGGGQAMNLAVAKAVRR